MSYRLVWIAWAIVVAAWALVLASECGARADEAPPAPPPAEARLSDEEIREEAFRRILSEPASGGCKIVKVWESSVRYLRIVHIDCGGVTAAMIVGWNNVTWQVMETFLEFEPPKKEK